MSIQIEICPVKEEQQLGLQHLMKRKPGKRKKQLQSTSGQILWRIFKIREAAKNTPRGGGDAQIFIQCFASRQNQPTKSPLPQKIINCIYTPPISCAPPRVFLAASLNRIKSEVRRVEDNTNTSGDVINAFTTFLVVEDCVQS